MKIRLILLICCLSGATWAQTQSNINGLITDSSGEPLIGVSIQVKGTTHGTISDLDGKFMLLAKTGDILRISYVGYTPQEIKLTGNQQLRIIMEEDTKMAGRSRSCGIWHPEESKPDRISVFDHSRRTGQ